MEAARRALRPRRITKAQVADLGLRLRRWWRGQDLNLRPSGYEFDGPRLGLCRLVPRRASELGLRDVGVSLRTSPSPPTSFDPLEVPLEVWATTP